MTANQTPPPRLGGLLFSFGLSGGALLGFAMLNAYQPAVLQSTPNAGNPQQQSGPVTTTPTADPYPPSGYQYDDSAYRRQQQQMQEAARQFDEDHWAWEEEQVRQQYIQEQNSH